MSCSPFFQHWIPNSGASWIGAGLLRTDNISSHLWQPYFVLFNLHLKGICGTHSLHVMCIQSLKVIQYEILCIVHLGMKMNVCM